MINKELPIFFSSDVLPQTMFLSDVPVSSKTYEERMNNIFYRSIISAAMGDALGASSEFKSNKYLSNNPITDMTEGGTWGLKKGQWTDDTSMMLCLAVSLISCKKFDPIDQITLYTWWYKHGYMSSTGECFDIGYNTAKSLDNYIEKFKINKRFIENEEIDWIVKGDSAGNGSLMRLAPISLYFNREPKQGVLFSGLSSLATHGDRRAYDSCRYYGALIIAAVRGESINDILSDEFYDTHKDWFSRHSIWQTELCPEVIKIANGSYKKRGGYRGGIRGNGFCINALEAALWALWNNQDKFIEDALLDAVNLGDDTDTTAAICGQLAGLLLKPGEKYREFEEQIYANNQIYLICEFLNIGSKEMGL